MPDTRTTPLLSYAHRLFRTASIASDPAALRAADYYRSPEGQADLRRRGRLIELLFATSR